MSTMVMAACWPLQMTSTAKAVLISLADNANDHGVCWPSIPTIMLRTCLGKTAVIEAIQQLEQSGLLSIERTQGRGNRYQLTPAADLFQPVRHAHPSATRTGSPAALDPSATRTGPVRHADPNRKEPSGTVKKASAPEVIDFSSWPSPPSPQVLADFLAHRKAKRAPITPTVIENFGRELHKAVAHGISVDAALAECITRNWQGLKADWLLRDLTPATRAGPASAPMGKQMQGLMALEEMKRGLVRNRDSDGTAEVGVLLLGADAGR